MTTATRQDSDRVGSCVVCSAQTQVNVFQGNGNEIRICDACLANARPVSALLESVERLIDTLHASKRIYWNNALLQAVRLAKEAAVDARGGPQ